jgi:hypothetical protein
MQQQAQQQGRLAEERRRRRQRQASSQQQTLQSKCTQVGQAVALPAYMCSTLRHSYSLRLATALAANGSWLHWSTAACSPAASPAATPWMFPWERRQLQGGALRWWEKMYWGVFVVGISLILFNRLEWEKEPDPVRPRPLHAPACTPAAMG